MVVNLWYDYVDYNQFINNLIPASQRIESSKSLKRFLKRNAELPNFLKTVGLDFNVLTSQAIPYLKNHNWDEKQYLPVEINFFTLSDPSILNFKDSFFLKNGKSNSDFLFWFPNEAPEDLFYDHFDIIKEKFPNMRVRYVSGNLKTPQWILKRDFIDYKSFDYFWWTQQQTPKFSLDKNKEEKYSFTFYNHRSKLHRAVSYYTLLTEGKLTTAKHTYHGYVDIDIRKNFDYFTKRETINSVSAPEEYLELIKKSDFLEWCDLNITRSFNFNFSNFVDSSLHNESYLDFSTETMPIERSDHFFITEKTYRPIANGCIFLTLAQPGVLKYLKSKGIETFGDLFDESYDETSHWYNRWKIIKSNIEIWLKLGANGRRNYYKKSFDKLVHNQNVIYNRNFKAEIEELFK